jgi:hypothetical protein
VTAGIVLVNYVLVDGDIVISPSIVNGRRIGGRRQTGDLSACRL